MLVEGFNPNTDKVESLRSMGNNAAYNYVKVTGGVARQNPAMRVTGSLTLQKVGDGRLIVTARNLVSNPHGNDYASWSVREGVLQIGDNQALTDGAVYLNGSGLVQVGYQFKAQPAKALTLEGRVALGAEVLDKENRIQAAFEGIPGAYFTTRSAEDSRLMGLFDLGLNYQATDALSMRLKYHLTYQPDFRSHGGEVEVKYTF